MLKRPIEYLSKQSGAALILIAFILGLGAAAFMIKSFNVTNLQAKQDEKTYNTLKAAKAALIAYAVAHSYSPGQMPWPDRSGDGNYDGSSDCVATPFQYSYLLGQLPSQPDTSPCLNPKTGLVVYSGLSTFPGLGQEFRDAQGNRVWYAVSRNLVRDYETATNPIINPSIVTTPSYPWLKVQDRNGNIISNRVAAVLIAPGNPIGGQNHSTLLANDYLESFKIGSTTYTNHSYAYADQEFIMGEDSRNVSDNDTTFQKPYYFNDKVVFITIDELMGALEKRIGEEVRAQLKTYKALNSYYPYANQLGTTVNFSGEEGLLSGFLPVDYQSCAYTRVNPTSSSLTCVQPIFDVSSSGITQIRFTRSGGSSFTKSTGCTFASNTCTCFANGSCSDAANNLQVVCTNNQCVATGTGAAGTYLVTSGKFTYRSGGCTQTAGRPSKTLSCTNSNSLITCSSATAGNFSSTSDSRFDNLLPTWFEFNQWQSYVYYQLTKPANNSILVGPKATGAVIVTSGALINSAPFAIKGSAQVRPSCNVISNYLDSTENTNLDSIYDATSKLKSQNYNDQTFTVAP